MQKSGRLELTWARKSYETESFEPRLLVEDKEKSYGDDSPNMLIHGDNLLALKALELDYMEAVQCIYIDPPFNTGGRIDASGQEIGYDDGLEHSIWLDMLKRSCPELSDAHCEDIVASILGAMTMSDSDKVSLVVTAPPSFTIKARTTMNVVQSMINGADRNILITGYSLSSYFSELVDTIIQKSQRGVFVKFFVNDIDKQPSFDKILRYKGRFLKIYNYRQDDDKMAALHAKVISVDQQQTLITSANLSYHGQQGNIELGTLIESKQIAKQIDDIFTKLIFTKDFCEI